MKKAPYKIAIADDHQIFLDGLQLIFSDHPTYEIVAEAHNGEEVMKLLRNMHVDAVILDINMPKPNGFETCKMIRKEYPHMKVIGLSMYNESQFVEEFLKSGASAYVLKNAGKVELQTALDVSFNNGTYISKELRNQRIEDETEKDGFVKTQTLTKREIEIISLLAKGKSSQEIATELFLSVYTVNTHRKNIHQKLGLKNSAGLIKFASDNHLI